MAASVVLRRVRPGNTERVLQLGTALIGCTLSEHSRARSCPCPGLARV